MRNPTLRAGAFALVAMAFAVCGGAAAQQQSDAHRGRDDSRGDPRGPPPRTYQRFDPPRAREGPIRREPGPNPYGPPASYFPPGYPSPPYRRPAEMGGGQAQPRGASMSTVIEGLQRRYPGRQLDAAPTSMEGRPAYRVLWLTPQGRRMDLIVDAETGVVISER